MIKHIFIQYTRQEATYNCQLPEGNQYLYVCERGDNFRIREHHDYTGLISNCNCIDCLKTLRNEYIRLRNNLVIDLEKLKEQQDNIDCQIMTANLKFICEGPTELNIQESKNKNNI